MKINPYLWSSRPSHNCSGAPSIAVSSRWVGCKSPLCPAFAVACSFAEWPSTGGWPILHGFREGWVIRASELHSEPAQVCTRFRRHSNAHPQSPSPCGKIEASGDPHVLFKVRQTSRSILPLLPRLRSHHLRGPSAPAGLLSEPQPTHAPAQQPHDRRSLRRLCSPLWLGHQRRPYHHGARCSVHRHRRRRVSRPLGHHPRSSLRPSSKEPLTSSVYFLRGSAGF